MVKQSIHMHRSLLVFFFGVMVMLLSSCTVKIPEGDIKDFVEQFDYDLAYQWVQTGKSVITVTYSVEGKEDGKVCSTTLIDKSGLEYHYMNTDVSGSYYGMTSGKYNYFNQQILSYMNEDETASAFQLTDGALEDISYRPEDVTISVHNFFYTELEAGYHRGGVYYGDYILANCGRYYSCFSLNEAKTELTYQVNTSTKNSDGDEILTLHHFVVNEYGMILSLSSKSIIIEKDIIIETTIACEYNLLFDKKVELII